MFSQSINTPTGSYQVFAEIVMDRVHEGEVVTDLSFIWTEDGKDRTASFQVRAEGEAGLIGLYHDEENLGVLQLNGDSEDVPDEAALDEALATADQLATVVGAVDPVVGCLIKGATASVIKQTVKCWRATNQNDTIRQRATDAANCVRQAGWSVAWSFVRRVGLCLVKLGLD